MVQHNTTDELRALATDALNDINVPAFLRGVLHLFNEPLWNRGEWDRSTIHIRADRVDAFRDVALGESKLPPPEAVLHAWFRDHAAREPGSDERKDLEAARARFGPSIKRDEIRMLRRDPSMRPYDVRKGRGRPRNKSARTED